MKIKVGFLVFMLCIATTASAFARGGIGYMVGQGYSRGGGHYDGYRSKSYYGGHSGRYYGNSSRYYRNSGRYYGHSGRYYGHSGRYYGHRGHDYDDGLGIAVGVVGGMILGSALAYSAAPPPQTVVYGAPTVYQPQVVVQQPRVCVEERRVSGEWQASQFDGRQVWVEFAYPITQRIQVPCY